MRGFADQGCKVQRLLGILDVGRSSCGAGGEGGWAVDTVDAGFHW